MEIKGEIKGLEAAMRNLTAAFPKQAEEQRRLLNRAMGASARKSILPMAKSLALMGDGSGALSESLGVRAVSKSAARRKGASASMQIMPVRYNKKAMALYENFYYKNKGKINSLKRFAAGIRHGHLVEFGTVHSAAKPYLYPALSQGKGAYINVFAEALEKKIMAKVRANARKNKGKW